jgi:hypothetical protein
MDKLTFRLGEESRSTSPPYWSRHRSLSFKRPLCPGDPALVAAIEPSLGYSPLISPLEAGAALSRQLCQGSALFILPAELRFVSSRLRSRSDLCVGLAAKLLVPFRSEDLT